MIFLKQGKTNWKYILIVFILAAIVGRGILGYQWWVEKQEVKIPEKIAKDETADWKTYRNEKYEFGFKYPKEYSISWAIDYHNPLEEKYYDPESEVIFSLSMRDPNIEFQWCNMTISETKYNNIDNWAKDFVAKSKKPYFHEGAEFSPPKIISIEDLNIFDIKVKKIKQEEALFCSECINIAAINGGHYYIFGCSNGEKKFTQDEKLLVEKIISTFRFLEQITLPNKF